MVVRLLYQTIYLLVLLVIYIVDYLWYINVATKLCNPIILENIRLKKLTQS